MIQLISILSVHMYITLSPHSIVVPMSNTPHSMVIPHSIASLEWEVKTHRSIVSRLSLTPQTMSRILNSNMGMSSMNNINALSLAHFQSLCHDVWSINIYVIIGRYDPEFLMLVPKHMKSLKSPFYHMGFPPTFKLIQEETLQFLFSGLDAKNLSTTCYKSSRINNNGISVLC